MTTSSSAHAIDSQAHDDAGGVQPIDTNGNETAAFLGGLTRRVGRFVRRVAPVVGRVARVAAPIGLVAVAAILVRRRAASTAGTVD